MIKCDYRDLRMSVRLDTSRPAELPQVVSDGARLQSSPHIVGQVDPAWKSGTAVVSCLVDFVARLAGN